MKYIRTYENILPKWLRKSDKDKKIYPINSKGEFDEQYIDTHFSGILIKKFWNKQHYETYRLKEGDKIFIFFHKEPVSLRLVTNSAHRYNNEKFPNPKGLLFTVFDEHDNEHNIPIEYLYEYVKDMRVANEDDFDTAYYNMITDYTSDHEATTKFSKLVPGNYIIYADSIYDWEYKYLNTRPGMVPEMIIKHLILARIEKNERSDKYVHRKDIEFYTTIRYIDFISNGKELIEKNGVDVASVLSNKIIYTTRSLVDAKNKFEELKNQQPYENWILDDDINKYNL